MKQKLSKKQLQAKRKAKEEQLRLEASAKALARKWEDQPTFSSRIPAAKGGHKVQKMPVYATERIAEARAAPSLVTTESCTGIPLAPKYEGPMAERERVAREKKHVVAPAANKMGYQLITNPEDLKTMGRKL